MPRQFGINMKEFEAAPVASELKLRSVRGAFITVGSQAIKFFLTLARTAILARLLMPEDFGLIAMVAVVVNFASLFKDAGLSLATIQQENITHRQISGLFWANLLLSTLLGIGIICGSPLVAQLYGRPELTNVTAVLGIAFIISGLSIQHTALLKRQLRLGRLAAIQLLSQVVFIVCASILALFGWRYWALVGGTMGMSITTILLAFLFCPWVPGWIQKNTGLRKMLAFGGHLTAANLIIYFVRNLDNILLGTVWGAAVLGIYTKAYSILMLPISQINGPVSSVLVPALSRLQNNEKSFRRYFLTTLGGVTSITFPVVFFCFVSATDLVMVLLGKDWRGAIPIFRALAPAALLGCCNMLRGWVLIPLGLSSRVFWLSLAGGVPIIAAFFIGLPWGGLGVAIALSVSYLIKEVPQTYWAFRDTPITLKAVGSVIWRPAAASLLATGLVYFVVEALFHASSQYGLRLAFTAIIMILSYFLFFILLPGGAETAREYVGIVKELRTAKVTTSTTPGTSNV